MTNPTLLGASLPNYTYASFNDYDIVIQAIAALLDHGIEKERIMLMLRDEQDRMKSIDPNPLMEEALNGITVTTGNDAKEGASKGAGIGLGVGVLAGLVSIIVPGAGLVIAGGALATAAAGVLGTGAAGAIAGAVTGYLVDQGADEETIDEVVNRLENGAIIVGVDAIDTPMRHLVHSILTKYEDVEILRA